MKINAVIIRRELICTLVVDVQFLLIFTIVAFPKSDIVEEILIELVFLAQIPY